MKIPLSVFAANKCCDSESSRYALGGLLIEQDSDGTPYAVATDGRHMAILTWKDTDQSPGVGPAIIQANVCESLANAKNKFPLSRRNPDAEEVTFAMNGDGKARLSIGSDPGLCVETRPIEGRFPKWRDVVPRDRKGERTVRVDHRLLAQLVDVIAAHCCNSEQRGICITIPEDDSAVLIRAELEDNKAIGVLMPIRVDSGHDPKYPQWMPSKAEAPPEQTPKIAKPRKTTKKAAKK